MNGIPEAAKAAQEGESKAPKATVDPRDVPVRVDTLSDSDETEATKGSSSLNDLPRKKKKKSKKKKKIVGEYVSRLTHRLLALRRAMQNLP